MKKFIMLLMGICSLALNAQETDTLKVQENDTTVVEFGKTKIIIIGTDSEEDCDTTHYENDEDNLTWWDGIDVGVNGYFFGEEFDINTPDGQEHLELNYAGSRSVSLNFAETKIKLIDDYVGIVTGMGLQYHSYKFSKGYTLGLDGDSLIAFKDTTINLRKNKLRTAYLVIPLMLEINTSKDSDRSFHISAGVIGLPFKGDNTVSQLSST